MTAPAWILRGRRILTPTGLQAASIVVKDAMIERIASFDYQANALPIYEAGDAVVMPGLVDSHVHINEPGRSEWEGFATATRAAAAGGITTLVDMPLNSDPVTTTAAALRAKRKAAVGQCVVDVAFWGGLVPGNLAELPLMMTEGVCGFKAFLTHSGIDDFPHVDEATLRQAMRLLAKRRVPLLVHAELDLPGIQAQGDPRRYETFLASRPPAMEVEAIKLLVRLVKETGCPVHVVHLSAADALPILAQARLEGLPMTVETCPHYLVFAAEEIPDGATLFKCTPPIRGRGNRERLWDGLRAGVIDFVACDHSPCTPALKRMEEGDFLRAWGGVASLQLSLPLVWHEAKQRGFTLEHVGSWLCDRPAAFAGLKGKGRIAAGYQADFTVWEPESTWLVTPESLHFKHKQSPYMGMTLHGSIVETFLRGRSIYSKGVIAAPPTGRLLERVF